MALREQGVHVLLRLALGRDGLEHADRDAAGFEDALAETEHVRVVGDDDGHNGHLGLHSEVEGTLFEWQQIRVVVVAARALWKDVDALARGVHGFGGFGEGGESLRARGTLDEHGLGESHCKVSSQREIPKLD